MDGCYRLQVALADGTVAEVPTQLRWVDGNPTVEFGELPPAVAAEYQLSRLEESPALWLVRKPRICTPPSPG